MTNNRKRLPIDHHRVEARRTPDGVAEIWAENERGFAAGLGFMHAVDRQVQMMLVRLVGEGRLSECLRADDQSMVIDTFSRGMGFDRDAVRDIERCSPEVLEFAEAYATGVNAGLRNSGRPLEFVLTSYRPEPWTAAATLATIKIMTYVGLGQTQQDLEKLLIESLRGEVSPDRLKRLMAPHLEGLDEATVQAIKDVREVLPLLPPDVRFHPGFVGPKASNNWAVAGHRTATGTALYCCDPHLEVNRLPAIWYEVVGHLPDDDRTGITMPGVPGLAMGRTRDLAFSFTYGFMDTVDYFIEEVRDGAYRRGDRWLPFEVHRETVHRKGRDPVVLTVRENDLGVVEADLAREELPDGYYLNRAWSARRDGAEPSLEAIFRLPSATTVQAAQPIVRNHIISCNWVLADAQGNVGYQQSGRAPIRHHSGLFPVPAWDEQNLWSGWVPPAELHSELNPDAGFVATANEEINPPDGPMVVNLPMGSYRADRIKAVLGATDNITIEQMKTLQFDLYSLHAERMLGMLDPVLPENAATRALQGWDRCYDRNSREATIFEQLYHALLERVFGTGCFGEEAWRAIRDTTCILTDFYHLFDNVLLGDDPSWFGESGKRALLASVASEVLEGLDPATAPPWGEHQELKLTNIFFGGALPAWTGFDYGPVELQGNRSTVVQGGILQSYGRLTSFAPSWRMVTDLAESEAFTALPGGPSGNRFSKYYLTDVKRWLDGDYKTLRLDP